jgi:lipopolysaccharide/colanic/teichoic acid biosynthesis glycosyltransferase
MNIHPVLLDSRPSYLDGGGPGSTLLMLPVGEGTLLSHLAARFAAVTPVPPVVLTTFEPTEEYRSAARRGHPSVAAVLGLGDLPAILHDYEPSDAMFLADPRCLPASGFDPRLLLSGKADPRWVRHLVGLEASPAGTRERVDIDPQGDVRRVLRYYESVTWPFTVGVAASVIPAACHVASEHLEFRSLADLRQSLSAQGVPSRDFPIEGGVLDLGAEHDALVLNDRFLRAFPPRPAPQSRGAVLVGSGHTIHGGARLMGAVVVHGDVVVQNGAMVVGPAVLGRGARIGPGAVVAQSILMPGAIVGPEQVIRHQVVTDGDGSARAAHSYESMLRSAERAEQEVTEDAERREGYRRVKSVLDAAAAGATLVLLSPFLLLVALLVKLDSKGPVLFGHWREGRGGRPFRCWKFRTMHVGAEAKQRELAAQNVMDGPQFKIDRDPRVTRMGRFLRPTSIDELPQLLNVLLGQMSLVGPRPSPFRENQLCVPWREGRLSVRPGITGLWQVCRHDRAAGDFHQWIQYDLLYVRHMSITLDVKIALATIFTMGGKGHVPVDWMIPGRRLREAE